MDHDNREPALHSQSLTVADAAPSAFPPLKRTTHAGNQEDDFGRTPCRICLISTILFRNRATAGYAAAFFSTPASCPLPQTFVEASRVIGPQGTETGDGSLCHPGSPGYSWGLVASQCGGGGGGPAGQCGGVCW